MMDVTVALMALVLASPVMLVIAILIWATDGAPAIFSHTRVGFDGKPFACYKFRTMVANSGQVLIDYLASNPEAAKEWEQNWKLKTDPRITFLGHILRKSSLDELPQLVNVLRGDMSCVGPRPVVPDELQRYGVSAADYLQARPGLTGLWQVTGRDAMDYPSRVSCDCRYIRNWSIWADVVILGRTIFAVMNFDHAS
jgi:exopolysaccharide production protein ExoY